MRVKPDYTQGDWQELADGYRATRTFAVLDLAGTSSDVLRSAANAVGIPDRNDPHPHESSIVVVRKTSRPLNDTSALVSVEYEVPTWENSPELVSQEITLDASVDEEKVYFDINSARIAAQYTIAGVGIVTQYPSATIARSRVTATIRKLETTSEGDLLLRSVAYMETVNNAVWFGWPAKTWKVEDLQSRPSKLSGYRAVTYTLVYNPDDWRFLATFIDRGRLPPDAAEGNGFAFFDTRQLTDFSQLPITVPVAPP